MSSDPSDSRVLVGFRAAVGLGYHPNYSITPAGEPLMLVDIAALAGLSCGLHSFGHYLLVEAYWLCSEKSDSHISSTFKLDPECCKAIIPLKTDPE
jgi:hypothetical protein